MDLKGSLVDTNIRIYPSDKLKLFLKNIELGNQIPVNIKKLIIDDIHEEEVYKTDLKPSKIYLSKSDIDMLQKIKSELNSNGFGFIDRLDVSGKSDEQASGLISEENCFETSKTVENGEEWKRRSFGFLITSDIDWLYNFIKEKKGKGEDIPYLHELLEGSKIDLPKNKIIKRNPVLEARCVKLRAQQEAREYRKMTKGVDNVRMRFPEDSISYQLKQMNRQLIAIGQFIISIFAGFLFGFRGVEWMVGNLDFGFRLLLGVMCALIIALAEIYFLAKKLNEELNVPETTQLGGPPTFADERFNGNKVNKHMKQHQD